LALTLARMAASVSIPATVTHGLTGGGDNNGLASAITDGRSMASIQDETSPLVLSNELLDWLADLGMDVLLPSFCHRNLRGFFGLWWDQSLAGSGVGVFR
jgi:hypothetical protein